MAPKDLLAEESAGGFGRVAGVTWRPATGFFEQTQIIAARRQHQVALAVRGALKATGLSGEELSRRLNKSPDHVGRKLRGEQWADLLDTAEWALALGDPLCSTRRLPHWKT